jgi:hypothetical protein
MERSMFRISRVLPPAAIAFLLFPFLLWRPAPVAAAVLLNEVLADPARDWNLDGTVSSRDDEWVEIINTGPGPVNLAGYRLAGPDSVWRYEFSGVLPAGAVQVVYGRQSYDWEVANSRPAYGLRLSNSGGEVDLFQVGSSGAVRVDACVYKDHEAEDDRSSARGPDGGAAWILCDGYNPYAGAIVPVGTGCLPSPGTLMNCLTPVQPATWGLVKSLLAR